MNNETLVRAEWIEQDPELENMRSRGDVIESEGAIFTLTEKGRRAAKYFVEHPERIKEDKAI